MPPKSQQEIVQDIRKKAVDDFLEYLKSRDLAICTWKQGKDSNGIDYALWWPISTEAISSYATKQ